MELALGQYHRSGVFTIWKHVSLPFLNLIRLKILFLQICPLVKGIGWATVLINFMTAMFYNTVISWAVYYLVMSFNGLRTELPWKSCHHPWNTECCVAADVKEYQYSSQLASIKNGIFNMTTTTTRATSLLTTTLSPKNCSRLVYSTEEYF